MTTRLLASTAAAGLTGVAAVTVITSAATDMSPLPPFSLTEPRFSQATFLGRWRQMMSNMDPSTLVLPSSQFHDARALLAAYRQGDPTATAASDAELWRARKLQESAFGSAPEVGSLVPPPFRMSGYVPFNGPICVAMMLASSTPAILFCQWLNQSHNALVNYFNRNPSAPMSTSTVLTSYATAVGMAMTVALGLSAIVKRQCSPAAAKTLLTFVAFPTAVICSSANCYVVRKPEIEQGWSLMDAEGRVIAGGQRSRAAAKRGVRETVASRALLQLPCVGIPALIGALPPARRMFARSPRTQLPFMAFVTMLAFGVGLPASVAVFPQIGTMRVADLEEALRPLCVDVRTGQPLTTVHYNKGL